MVRPPNKFQWIAIVLIVLFVVALFWALGRPEPATSQKIKWVNLGQTQLLDMGGQNTLWVHIEGNLTDEKMSNVTVRVDLTDSGLPRRMVLVDSPRAGGSNFSRLQAALEDALRPAGWKLEVENLSSLRAEGAGRVIILPSGAWPADALAGWKKRFAPDDLIIYVGIRQNITVGSDGSTQVGGVPAGLLKDGKPTEEYGEPLELLGTTNGNRVARIPRTLDEFTDMDALAQAIVRYAWAAPENRTVVRAEKEWNDGANDLTLGLGREIGRGALRVRLLGKDGRLLKLWDRDLSRPSGEIDGPARIVRSQTAAFQVRLLPDYPQKENLDYDLTVYSPDGKAGAKERIGQGVVGPGADDGRGGAWVGSFVVSKWPGPGIARLAVTDQFGRALAQAAVDIPQITITALDTDGLTRRYLILQDGEPINESRLNVRRANSSEWTSLPIGGGIVSVSAKFPPGSQTLLFELGGQSVPYSWNENSGGAWAVAWTYGLPGIALALVTYLLLKPRRRATYRLIVPEMAAGGGGELTMNMREMADALEEACGEKGRPGAGRARDWPGAKPGDGRQARSGPGARGRAVLRADEFAAYLQAKRFDDGRMIGPESAEEALRALAKTGRALQWRGYWTCKRAGFGEEDVRRQALGHQLKDKLLENGISLAGKTEGELLKDGRGRTWMLGPNSAAGLEAMAESRCLPSFALFADGTEREEAERGLKALKGGKSARLRLALQTGRMKLISLDEL